MRILTKTVECGEYKFAVSTDRDIAVRTFEAFPDFIEKTLRGGVYSADEKEFFVKAVREKKLGELLAVKEEMTEIAAYALPLMIEKAGGNAAAAEEITAYARANDADLLLAGGILEFLMQGFMQGERERAPKVRFAMK